MDSNKERSLKRSSTLTVIVTMTLLAGGALTAEGPDSSRGIADDLPEEISEGNEDIEMPS